MKEKIKKIITLINQWKIIVIIILIGVGLFYWYQIRPSMIYSKCHRVATEEAIEMLKNKSEVFGGDEYYKEAIEKKMYLKDDYDYAYKQCLRSRGINK